MLPGFEGAFEEIIKLLDLETSADMKVAELIISIVGYNPLHTLLRLNSSVEINQAKFTTEIEPERLLENLEKKMSKVKVLSSTLVVSDRLIDPFKDELIECSNDLRDGNSSKIIGITDQVMSFDKGAALMELHKSLTSSGYPNKDILAHLRDLVDLVRRYENSLREERSPTYNKSSQHLGDYSSVIGERIDEKIAAIEQIAGLLRKQRGQLFAKKLSGARATRAMFSRYDASPFIVGDGERKKNTGRVRSFTRVYSQLRSIN
jgi:hypothetical protein